MSLEGLLRRYDPKVKRRFRTYLLSNGARVRGKRVIGDERLARGLAHHLEGRSGEPESLEDLVRVFVAGRLLPAELALALPLDVVIREDAGLGLFWFENDDPDLTVCAHEVREVPLLLEGVDEVYVCGIDAPQGTSREAVDRAWGLADALAR
ncbi:hypothetical protein ACFQ07_30220, partial [Actinomadura adrarensis]